MIVLPVARFGDNTSAVPDGALVEYEGELYRAEVVYRLFSYPAVTEDDEEEHVVWGAEPSEVQLTPERVSWK